MAIAALYWAFAYVRQFYWNDIKEMFRKFGALIATVDMVWIVFGFIYAADNNGRWLLIVIAGRPVERMVHRIFKDPEPENGHIINHK